MPEFLSDQEPESFMPRTTNDLTKQIQAVNQQMVIDFVKWRMFHRRCICREQINHNPNCPVHSRIAAVLNVDHKADALRR